MAARKKRSARDIEKGYSPRQFAKTLRRIADALESGQRLRIQVAGERVSIPPDAEIQVEHERGKKTEEVELQLRWPVE